MKNIFFFCQFEIIKKERKKERKKEGKRKEGKKLK